MNDFDRCNKVTGVYWLKKPIENVEIKVRLKPYEGIRMLPKFESYKNDSNNTMHQLESHTVEEYAFKWQEKVFSMFEFQRYSDIHNCISETDLLYHDMIQDREHQPRKVHTCIHKDCHLPIPLSKLNKSVNSDVLNLSCCFVKMYLNEDTSSLGHLFRSEENVAMEEMWQAMHVVYDNSDYNEDSQLLLKQEVTLLSLYYNSSQNYLIVSPDTNNLELNPYQLDSSHEYSVDVTFGKGNGEELMILLQKLSKKWEKKQKQLVKFVTPPIGKKHYFVTLEILSAEKFDLDHLYIDFHIKVPDGLHCSDALLGRTHVSKSHTHKSSLTNDEKKQWSFGHLVELHLEAPTHTEPLPLRLFFEVISTDWWDRHRTEGYSYLPLTLDPGCYCRQLSCSRPEELDLVTAESRRFFVGGCHLIKDLEVLAKPQLQDANYKFTTTGVVSVRWSTITQVPLPGFRNPAPSQASHATAVLRGAEVALRQYRKARARLAEATKDIDRPDDD